jgi:hypothetical protein
VLPRIARTLLLALTLLFAVSASARAADTISISFGADPTEEVPLPVTVNWSAGTSNTYAYVTIKPSGPLGCGVSYAADEPNSRDVIDTYTNAAAGTQSRNWTLDAPGTYTLCGYLQDSGSSTAPRAVTGPVALTVREARASVALAVPPRVEVGATFAVNAPVTTELRRYLVVTVKPAGGRGCEATYALDEPNSQDVMDSYLQGTQTASRNFTASSTPGTYLLCAYVQENGSDPLPEATTSATFLVGPDPCVTARTALTKAQKAVKAAEAAVTRNRNAWKRYDRRAKAAHGAKRRSLAKQAKTYKSRYSSAIRTRSKQRAKLAAAQAAVTAACGS